MVKKIALLFIGIFGVTSLYPFFSLNEKITEKEFIFAARFCAGEARLKGSDTIDNLSKISEYKSCLLAAGNVGDVDEKINLFGKEITEYNMDPFEKACYSVIAYCEKMAWKNKDGSPVTVKDINTMVIMEARKEASKKK